MHSSEKNCNPAIPWSFWIWGIHGLFVYAFYYFMFTTGKPMWFKLSFSAISLGAEQSYAVWWSGICLFIGASLFYRAASFCHTLKQSWYWIILSVAMLALCYDEIGSLHEMVSKTFGWEYLIPFGAIFIIGFLSAVVAVYRQPGLKFAALLILAGVLLFGSVASLEFVEHNIELGAIASRQRLLVEESVELFAMTLIIISGLISVRKLGLENRRLANVAGNLNELALHPVMVFALFCVQFLAIVLFAGTHPGNFSEGNPAAVFPILIYFVLFLICIQTARSVLTDKALWWMLGMVFLFTSLCQIHSFTSLMLKNQIGFFWFAEAPSTWFITLVPLLLLTLLLLHQTLINIRELIPDFVVLLLISIIFYPDNYSPMIYELFAGCTGFVCYRLISRHLPGNQYTR